MCHILNSVPIFIDKKSVNIIKRYNNKIVGIGIKLFTVKIIMHKIYIQGHNTVEPLITDTLIKGHLQ
jgi:hypothetical protein